jgi:hypothetical protein
MLNAQTKHSGHRDHLLFAVPVVIVFSILNLVTSITEVYGSLLEAWKPNEDESKAPHHFKALVSLISCIRLIQPRRRWRCSKPLASYWPCPCPRSTSEKKGCTVSSISSDKSKKLIMPSLRTPLALKNLRKPSVRTQLKLKIV